MTAETRRELWTDTSPILPGVWRDAATALTPTGIRVLICRSSNIDRLTKWTSIIAAVSAGIELDDAGYNCATSYKK